jgi:hypothetical protein
MYRLSEIGAAGTLLQKLAKAPWKVCLGKTKGMIASDRSVEEEGAA